MKLSSPHICAIIVFVVVAAFFIAIGLTAAEAHQLIGMVVLACGSCAGAVGVVTDALY